ncbi:MAG: cell division protease FtsH [Frankiales bacterium]|nr:cell division protease FtsH [Frankiales bacterium]
MESIEAASRTAELGGSSLLDIGGTSVISAERHDVARIREKQRRRRLWNLAVLMGIPTAYFWYRLADGRPFDVFQFPTINWLVVVPMLFFALLFVLLFGVHVFTGVSPHNKVRPEEIDVTLNDVVGIDPVKEEVVRSLNLFLSHATFAKTTGGRARRGLLFEGAPGTGKTHTAKALAHEAGVPFLFATATSFQSSFQGATQRKVRNFFKALRTAARKEGGAIGFIDEFDALGMARSGVAMAPMPQIAGCYGTEALPAAYASVPSGTMTSPFTGGGDLQMAVNELLVQLQSFDQPAGMQKFIGRIINAINLLLPTNRQLSKPAAAAPNIMLIASTNRADSLDPALLRPGRFDRRLSFEMPDRRGRRALIDHFLSKKSHVSELDADEQRDILAGITQGYSPAMIEHLCDEALVHAVRRGEAAMTWTDIEHARLVEEVGIGQPVGYTTYERRLIATHEAGHATAAYLVAPERRLEVLTIIKRREALGLLAHGDREDVYTRSRTEMLALIEIALAGQCAEEIFFGDISTGPGGDLLYATNVAAQMVGGCGMAGSLVSYMAVQNSAFSDTNIVGRVLADPDGRAKVEELLQDQKVAIRALLVENAHLVAALRDALLDREELIGPEITDILEAARASGPADRVIDLRAAADIDAAALVD